MTEYSMPANLRQDLSKSHRREILRQGLIPAVVYGKNMASQTIEVLEKDLQNALSGGRNTIITLKMKGNGGPYKVMVKDLQLDPIRRSIVHADFQQINLRDKIHASVSIHLSGEAAEGLAQLAVRKLEISCLASKIPDQITVDVSGMRPGDSVAVADLEVPKGVEVLDDLDMTVVTVLETRGEAVETAGPGEKAAEAPEKEGSPESPAH